MKASRALIPLLIAVALATTPASAAPPKAQSVQKACERVLRKTRPYRKLLKRLYKTLGGCPLLTRDGVPTEEARQALAWIAGLDRHGIASARYLNATVLREEAQPTAKDAAKKDVRLMRALLRVALDLRVYVRAHPRASKRRNKKARKRRKEEIIGLVAGLFPDVSAGLAQLLPDGPEYERLLAGLARYRKLAVDESGGVRLGWRQWTEAKAAGGARFDEAVRALQRRLAAAGYLGETGETGGMAAPTLAALDAFREAHGFAPGGGVSQDVLHLLGPTADGQSRRVALALQRFRESSPLRRGTSTYLRVNIPAFELELHEAGEIVGRQRVIVGKGGRNRTPLLETVLHKVVLNPHWYVPSRFMRSDEEDAPKTRVVPPGPHNPMGPIKMLLRRGNAIHLHSTNKPQLFASERRALSHGCVRVEDALELGRFLARERSKVSLEQYDRMLATGRTWAFSLMEPLPVFVQYMTVTADEQGRLRFLDDVYGYDRKVLEALAGEG